MPKIRKIGWTDLKKNRKWLFLSAIWCWCWTWISGETSCVQFFITLRSSNFMLKIRKIIWTDLKKNRKRVFLSETCSHYGRTGLFGKTHNAQPFSTQGPLTLYPKSEKSEGRIWRNKEKGKFCAQLAAIMPGPEFSVKLAMAHFLVLITI